MQFFDSSLGVPVSERSYAANCALTWENVKGNLDVFVASHFLGWVVKALILRDALLCWIISIQWELIEILFMHMLPNFAE
jgi:phosphatidylserine synthase 2